MEKTQYIQRARALSNDPTSYTKLTMEDALFRAANIRAEIKNWISDYKHVITREECKFLQRHLKNVDLNDPFATFYILVKIHNNPIGQRPVVSYSGSLLYALAVWCDTKLQPFAQQQQAYLKSSFTLKERLNELQLPPNDIPTQHCLASISKFIQENFHQEFTHHVSHDALTEALRVVMSNNMFKFGDTFWLQSNGAAMGAPPCPAWATMYFAPYEDDSCNVFSDSILFYVRYIDDVFGIWLQQPGDDATLAAFQTHT